MYAISREIIRTHRTAPTDDMIATSSVDRIVDSAVVGFESSIKKNEMRFSVGPVVQFE